MQIARDTVVDGRYRLIERLGAGGMAEVWSAEDSQLGRQVALKLLHERLAADPDFVERFRREASSAAGLQHPSVVQVYDRGEWAGTYYIAMEYLRGETLKDVVRRGPLPPDRAADVIVQVLRAAGFAHRRGLVHRDFKPHNAIFDDEGRVKVTDFGIARAGASEMTETGSIMGTAQYLSPEQAQGRHVTPRSDLYSIGVMLFELLTGRVPFDGDSPVTIALKHVSEPPPVPSSLNPAVPPHLDAVVARALAKDPARRFADADEFIAALNGTAAGATDATTVMAATVVAPAAAAAVTRVAGPPIAVLPENAYLPPEEPLEEASEPERRWIWWVMALLVLAALAAGAFLLLREDRERVPDVAGRTAAQATAAIERRGFEVQIEEQESDTVRRGVVISQDPTGGTEEAIGGTILIRVSVGPAQVAVPEVSGLSGPEAADALEAAGLESRSRRRFSEDVAEGDVIGTQPAAGRAVTKGSRVTILVSRGDRPVTVPDVTALDREEATRAISEAGLQPVVSDRETEAEAAGEVLEQRPAAGSEVEDGSEVRIVVAKAPPKVAVPGVVGLSEDDAVRQLEQAELRVRRENRDVGSPAEDGTVLEQTPAAGERVSPGKQVTLTVGRFDPADLDPDPTEDPGIDPGVDPGANPGDGDDPTKGAADEVVP